MCKNKRAVFFVFAFILFQLNAHAKVEADSPIAKAFIELYRNEDKNISLGAMLLSVDMYHKESLESHLRTSIKATDTPLEKTIKLYTLSKFTYDYIDMKNFIISIPENKLDFQELLDFECSVTKCPHSPILKYLIRFVTMDTNDMNSTDIELKNLAKRKIDKIFAISDGWVSESIECLLNEK